MTAASPESADATIRAAQEVTQCGYDILPAIYGRDEIAELTAGLTAAIACADSDGDAIRSRTGVVYAARNVLQLYPAAADVWRVPALIDLLSSLLGPQFGLVRALFFDKPPDRTWSLAWHKDLTIAVLDNSLRSQHFTKPTRKAGVAHVEAPLELLQAMLTLRIHLDDVSEENGPLRVIPASHLAGKNMQAGDAEARSIFVAAGDVLAMRPLLVHSSPNSHADTQRHRRILHLEFAGWPTLPDGYQWHQFLPL